MDTPSTETDPMSTAIANQMRIQRTIRRWSQDDLANAAGLGRSTILRLETTRITMNIRHMQGLSTAFEMPWIEFLKLVNAELEGSTQKRGDGRPAH